MPGEVIVRFRAGTTTAARRSSLASTEGQVAQSLGLAGVTFRFTSLQAGAKFECRHMSGPWTACTSPRTYRSLALGSHTFRVRAIDPSGNIDATPAVRTWRINRP